MKNLVNTVILASFLSVPLFAQEKPERNRFNRDLTGDGIQEQVVVDTSGTKPILEIKDGASGKIKKFNHFAGFKGLHYLKDGNSIVYLTGLTEDGNLKGFEIKYESGEYVPAYKVFTQKSNPDFFK
ncbi:hypothetical protein A3K62_02795 [Candidatus Pacearchaeota archaeon RBG_16_35_8]|nr:MAG: hypothetical protein A3K62_02795 [Candidatus Pacearchaeota archaeon RBG_16_35_8]